MYQIIISQKLLKILHKLLKKDPQRYEIIHKKIIEIAATDPQHYKNLRYPMQMFKRVHIDSSFVMLFHVDENTKTVTFEDLQHHDDIY